MRLHRAFASLLVLALSALPSVARAGSPPGTSCGAGVDCQSGFCVDGVCCDTACGAGDVHDCQACSTTAGAPSNGTCALLGNAFTCRPTAGACDEAETCTGASPACPADSFHPASWICRPKQGPCDVQENCSGAGVLCPADALAAAGTLCGAPAPDACHTGAVCSGAQASCSPSAVLPDGTACPDGFCQAGMCVPGGPGSSSSSTSSSSSSTSSSSSSTSSSGGGSGGESGAGGSASGAGGSAGGSASTSTTGSSGAGGSASTSTTGSSGAGGDGVKAQAPVGNAASACAYDPAGGAPGSSALTLAALALAWLRASGKRARRGGAA